mmetsp:Transcript_38329/g.90088  ORF Transcript_38329/g.90088 Transcript_38329/m.90088 type:complete len:746 (+) Transcript_38329:114-2351(+)
MGCGASALPRSQSYTSEIAQTTTSSFSSKFGFSKTISSVTSGPEPLPQVVNDLEQLKSVAEDEGARNVHVKLEAPSPADHAEFGTDVATLLGSMRLASHLHLDLSGPAWTDDWVSSLCDALVSLVRLQHLEVALSSDALTDTAAIALANAIEGLIRLKHFKLKVQSDNIGDIGIAALATSLESLTSLRHLELDLGSTYLGDQGLHALANSLSYLFKLRHNSMCLSSTAIGASGIRSLSKALSGLRQLEELKLDLSHTAVGESGAVALASAFKSLTRLKVLDINLEVAASPPQEGATDAKGQNEKKQDSMVIGQSGLDAIYAAIQAMSSELWQLSLRLSNHPVDAGLVTEEQSQLGKALASKTTLRTLHLDLRGTSLSTAGVSSLVTPLGSLKELHVLECRFGGCKEIHGTCMTFAKALEALTLLEKAALDFSTVAIGKEGATALAGSISSMPRLERLELAVRNCSLTDEEVDTLMPSFKLCPNLTSLHLDVRDNNLTPNGHRMLAVHVGIATALTELRLMFAGTGVADTSLEELARSLSVLPALTDLELLLRTEHEPDKQVRDRGVKALAAGLEHLQSLQRFILRLPSCDAGDEGFIAITAAIGNRPLETLEVDLSASTKAFERGHECVISDRGIGAVARRLRSMRSLTRLLLGIGNSSVTAKGASLLSASLQEHARLEEVEFDAHGSPLGDLGVADVAAAVARLPSMRHVDMDLRGCSLSNGAAETLTRIFASAKRPVLNEIRL